MLNETFFLIFGDLTSWFSPKMFHLRGGPFLHTSFSILSRKGISGHHQSTPKSLIILSGTLGWPIHPPEYFPRKNWETRTQKWTTPNMMTFHDYIFYLCKTERSVTEYVTHIFTKRPSGLETWNLAERWAFGRRWTKIHKIRKMLPW